MRFMMSTYAGSCRRCVPATIASDFCLRGGGRCDHGPDAGGIDRDRLLREDVFARGDRRREMQRAGSRRRREDHEVDVVARTFWYASKPLNMVSGVTLN